MSDKKATRADRELVLLMSAEDVLSQLLNSFSRPSLNYSFLREPLGQLRNERAILQAARDGDPHARRMRSRKRSG